MTSTQVFHSTRWLRLVIIAVALASAATLCFLSSLVIVPTPSMRPTLVPGDIVLCLHSASPKRGDVVVFSLPNSGELGIKRVIGEPGDSIDYVVDKTLSVNHTMLTKTLEHTLGIDDPMDLLYQQVIDAQTFHILESYGQSLTTVEVREADGYFLLGDSRDESVDSRHFGAIRRESILCEAKAILGTERNRRFTFDRVRAL